MLRPHFPKKAKKMKKKIEIWIYWSKRGSKFDTFLHRWKIEMYTEGFLCTDCCMIDLTNDVRLDLRLFGAVTSSPFSISSFLQKTQYRFLPSLVG